MVSRRPVLDPEFEGAIASLEASTAAIETQCALLEVQKQALAQLCSREKVSAEASSVAEHQNRKVAREKAQVDLEVEEVAGTLQERLSSLQRQSEGVVGGLPSTVTRVLEKDDRLLDGLQELGPKLEVSEDETMRLEEVEHLCQALILLQGKSIRSRIDTAYQESLDSELSEGMKGDTDDQNVHDDIQTTRAELDELCSEIDGLLTMVVDHEYRNRVTRSLRDSGNEATSELARWAEYLVSTLQYLAARLETADEHVQGLKAYHGALRDVHTALTDVIKTSSNPISQKGPPVTAQATSKPAKNGLKPLLLVKANISDPSDPATQLLRHLEVRPGGINDSAKLNEALAKADFEREDRLAALSATTVSSMTKQVADSLAKADADLDDLHGAVHAHSKYASIRLADPLLAGELEQLELETSKLGEQMRKLDLEAVGRSVKDKQKAFVDQLN